MNSTTNIRFGIGGKLLALFGLVCLLFLALIGYAVFHIHRTGGQLEKLGHKQIPALLGSSKIKDAVFAQQKILEDALLASSSLSAGANAEAAARFQQAGAPARELLSNSSAGLALRENLKFMYDAENQQGHLDEEEARVLKIEPVAELFASYESGALALLTGTSSIDARTVFQRSDDIISHLEDLDRVALGFVSEDAEMLLSEQRTLTLTVLISGIALALISTWLIVGLVNRITRPLAELTRVSQRIAEGDLSTSVTPIETGDELAVLGAAFSTMRENLRTQTEQIRAGVEMLGAAINQIGASIQEQAASAKEEAATIQEITTTMQEIQQSGGEISNRAREVSNDSDGTVIVGEQGLEAVGRTTESMERIREQVEEVAEKIVSLSEKTQAIGEIIATVNEIAEQSNILAINAGIEAASAGESGGRFSVVAQEMKHLADQAKNSTRLVRSILEEIQKGINTSVMLTEEAVKRTDSGRAQAGVTLGTIQKLTDSIQSNVQTFGQIIAGTGQQQIGINQVVQGMQDIKQAVQQTVSGITQLEQATRSLNDMSVNLRGVVARYKL